MNIVYKKESKHEGNDCMIYESAFVVEVDGGYIACVNTIVHGYWGPDGRSKSCAFNSFEDAVEYCEEANL